MDGTVQCLPFVEVQQHAAWHFRHRPGQHRGIKNPPGNDTIQRQAALQALAACQLALFKMRCHTSIPQRHAYHSTRSMASAMVSTAMVVNNSHSMGVTSVGGSTS